MINDNVPLPGLRQSPVERRVQEIVAPAIIQAGYRLVQLRYLEGKHRGTLQVMAEPEEEGRQMTVEDCAEISYLLSALLEVEDPISNAYNLEVSSPGIDRPLITRNDYKNYLGFHIKLETLLPVQGRKRFKGLLQEVLDDGIVLDMPEATVTLQFEMIANCKLELTDALVRRYLSEGKKREQQQKKEHKQQKQEKSRKQKPAGKSVKKPAEVSDS
jgi:ribosome maturation factor RimP